jgi:peptidoglycan/LPS O-acetylase OafA/YrhL
LKYEPSLDGIRSLAVVAVLTFHAFPDYIPGGWIGVDLFFVLSGFLITKILLDEIDRTGTLDLRIFYYRRFLRLMPPLWSVLLAVLPVIIIAKNSDLLFKAWAAAATYLMNFNRAFGWGPEYPLGHTWSLAAEEQFYLIWPVFILLAGNRRRLWWWTIILIAVSIAVRLFLISRGASPIRIYNGFVTHSDPILFGCVLAATEVPVLWRRVISELWPLWLGLIFALTIQLPAMRNDIMGVGLPLLGLLGCFLIISAMHGEILRALLSIRPIVFTGKISYALYLWHFPLLQFSAVKFHLTGFLLFIPVAVSFCAAILSHYTLEAFFRKLKLRTATANPGSLALSTGEP